MRILTPRSWHALRGSATAAICLLLALVSSGCTICAADADLYAKLQTTKAEVVGQPASGTAPAQEGLYDKFKSDPMPDVSASRANVDELVAIAERNQRKHCKEPVTLSKLIKSMFERHVQDRTQNGKWNDTHATNQKMNMAEQFDQAIELQETLQK